MTEQQRPAVRLVVSDMDGTLLDGESQVPPETFGLVERLTDAGIRFAAASGRRYDTLLDFFRPVADRMDFVASNGTQVYIDGKVNNIEFFSAAALRRLKATCDMFDCLHLALFDETDTFLLDDTSVYLPELDKDLPNAHRSTELPDALCGIVKTSVFCTDEPMDMAYVLSRELDDDFVFAPSGHSWIDVMKRGVNKATGITQVMDAHGIAADEVIAFGDSMNDYEILRLVGYSRAMGNARPAVKQISECTIGTNLEHAVQSEIAALLESRGR